MSICSPNSFLHTPFHLADYQPHNNSGPSRVRLIRKQPCPVVTASYTCTSTAGEMATAAASSLYEVLGIPMSASGDEIKVAYRRLARVCHPDVVAVNKKETSANEFKKIHAAYSTLSDPNKRADYDRDLYLRGWCYGGSSSRTMRSATMAAASSAMSGFSRYTHKNWETDQCW